MARGFADGLADVNHEQAIGVSGRAAGECDREKGDHVYAESRGIGSNFMGGIDQRAIVRKSDEARFLAAITELAGAALHAGLVHKNERILPTLHRIESRVPHSL